MKKNKMKKQSVAPATTVLQSHLMDLHLITMRVLKEVNARRSLVGQIERATTNAVLAFEQAIVGYRQRYQMRRTHAALVVCRKSFRMLCLEGYVERRVFDEVRRRVDQLMEVFARLERAPAAEWATISIPPLEQRCADETKDRELDALQRTGERVAAVLRSIGRVVPITDDESGKGASGTAKSGEPQRIADAA
jgi:hypothetical protein